MSNGGCLPGGFPDYADQGGRRIQIINYHLKSKLLAFPGGAFTTKDESLRAETAYLPLQRRAAETTTIREHVTDLLDAKDAVIVLGDFNDGPRAATTEIFYGPTRSQPTGPDDATNLHAFQRSDQRDASRLFNVTMLVPRDKRWSKRSCDTWMISEIDTGFSKGNAPLVERCRRQQGSDRNKDIAMAHFNESDFANRSLKAIGRRYGEIRKPEVSRSRRGEGEPWRGTKRAFTP